MINSEKFNPGDEVYYVDSTAGKVKKGIVDDVSDNPPSVLIINNTTEKWYHVGLVSSTPFQMIPNRNYKNLNIS